MRSLFTVLIFTLMAHSVHGGERDSLNAFCRKYGFPQPVYEADTVTYKSPYTEMVFRHNSRMIRFNGVLIWMLAGAENYHKEWKLSRADCELVLAPLLRAGDFADGRRAPRLVLIDPGHGGSQTGAKTAGRIYEKDLVLDIAERIRNELGKMGIKSMLTRDRDIALSLDSRSRKIGELGADLFVSVHLNSAGNSSAAGVETYIVPVAGYPSTAGGGGAVKRVVGNRNDALNSVLAYLLQRDILRRTGAEDRGVKRARFNVISEATCPAVLLECGFMSNPAEMRRLNTEAYREKIATGAAKGIGHYFSLWSSVK